MNPSFRKLILAGMLSFAILASGCVASVGNRNPGVTVGQQLIDLQRAKEAGALTEAEFQAEKARLLGNR